MGVLRVVLSREAESAARETFLFLYAPANDN